MAGTYFAAAAKEDIAKAIGRVVGAYYANPKVIDLGQCQTKAWRQYYGWTSDGARATRVTRGGDQGELALVNLNHARSLASAMAAMITGPKVAWSPQAKRYEYEAVKQLVVAKRVLEHYWTNRKVGNCYAQAVLSAIVAAEGFVHTEWDASRGGKFFNERTGDFVFETVLPWLVVRDPRRRDAYGDWKIVGLQRNKWELAAKYPESADAILSSGNTTLTTYQMPMFGSDPGGLAMDDDDNIVVWRLYHLPTAVLPGGRDALVLGDGKTCLHYHDLEAGMPLVRIVADEQMATPFGDTPFFNILGVQDLMNAIHTSIASNQTTFGTSTVVYEEGTDPGFNVLPGGLSGFPVRPGGMEPHVLQLLKTPQEMFLYVDSLKGHMELLLGMNSVVRGESPGDRASGSLAAMLSAQAKENAGTLRTSYLDGLQAQGQLIVSMMKLKATRPLVIALAGQAKAGLGRTMDVKGSDLSEVEGVLVDMGNPLLQSSAGRMQIGETLAQKGLVTPTQLIEILNTGTLEPVTEGTEQESLNILRENEMMGRGEVPIATLIDDHLQHALQHKIELSSPSTRERPEVVDAVMKHLTQHYAHYYNVILQSQPGTPQWYEEFAATEQVGPMFHDRMMVLVGQVPPPPVGLPMGPPPPQDAGGGPPPPPQGGGSAPGLADGQKPAEMPRLPTNPGTGNQWEPVGGGGTPAPPGR